MVYGAFSVTVFKSPRFRQSTVETSVFQKAPLPKPYSKASVFISVLGRFSVNDRKRIKKVQLENN